jgi:hypothetical protein
MDAEIAQERSDCNDPTTGCDFACEYDYLHSSGIHTYCDASFVVQCINERNITDFSVDFLKRWYAYLVTKIPQRQLDLCIGSDEIINHYFLLDQERAEQKHTDRKITERLEQARD